MLDQFHVPGPHLDTSPQPFDEPRLPLRAGDIVMCKFPSAEARHPLEKVRPCLVLDVTDDEIVLAYGTTRDGHVRRSRELHVLRVEELAAAGLWRPTRFLGWRTVRLAGAIGLMTLAVMTRATLGHTGLGLTAGRGTISIYVALVLSVPARVAAGIWTEHSGLLHIMAGLGWIAAFGGFVLVYGPLLTRRPAAKRS